MMRLLLDTHALIWTVSSPSQLSADARERIGSSDSMVFVSMASLWELQIKTTIGKLRLPDRFFEELEPAGFQLLPIALQDVERYGALPLHHRDPFDRMLIAQAQHHALTLVTRDDALARYDVDRLLA